MKAIGSNTGKTVGYAKWAFKNTTAGEERLKAARDDCRPSLCKSSFHL